MRFVVHCSGLWKVFDLANRETKYVGEPVSSVLTLIVKSMLTQHLISDEPLCTREGLPCACQGHCNKLNVMDDLLAALLEPAAADWFAGADERSWFMWGGVASKGPQKVGCNLQ